MLLLDTHVFYWVVSDPPRRPANHRSLLEDSIGPFYLSAISGLEIATKVRTGKWIEAAASLPNLFETAN